jgi:hypothetical protein
MNIKTLAAAACLSLLSATSSFAATFTVGGDDFDITTITGTFADLQGQLKSQIWWEEPALAADFASAVSSLLGLVNSGGGWAHFCSRGTGFSDTEGGTTGLRLRRSL